MTIALATENAILDLIFSAASWTGYAPPFGQTSDRKSEACGCLPEGPWLRRQAGQSSPPLIRVQVLQVFFGLCPPVCTSVPKTSELRSQKSS